MNDFRPKKKGGFAGPSDRIFYDGTCGLCHRLVRFVVRRDRRRRTIRFAPLGGSTYEQQIPSGVREELPDSLVVAVGDGRVLYRSAGVLYILRYLGGIWSILAGVVDLLPERLLDLGYDLVARSRTKLFRRPQLICPDVGADLANRFDA